MGCTEHASSAGTVCLLLPALCAAQFGWYHWEVDDAFASPDDPEPKQLVPANPARLLAMAPGVGWNTTTKEEFRAMAVQVGGCASAGAYTGQVGVCQHACTQQQAQTRCCCCCCLQMLKLASMLGRKLVMPDPPCSSPWIQHEDLWKTHGNEVRTTPTPRAHHTNRLDTVWAPALIPVAIICALADWDTHPWYS